MQVCACPAAAALTTIPNVQCAENFGQIQKVAFMRLRKADGTVNSFVDGNATGINKKAAWTAKMALTDGGKAVISPYIQAPTNEANDARTFGGGNDTLGGVIVLRCDFIEIPSQYQLVAEHTLVVHLAILEGSVVGITLGLKKDERL